MTETTGANGGPWAGRCALGAALAEYGRRVLLVDFDPQGALSACLGVRPATSPSLYQMLVDRGDVRGDRPAFQRGTRRHPGTHGRELHIDSRPSDAIALGVSLDVPIFVAEHVLEGAANTEE